MKKLTVKVKVKENKVKFFKELIRNLDFVELKKKRSKNKILSNIKNGLEEIASIEKGKNKPTPVKEFLNKL